MDTIMPVSAAVHAANQFVEVKGRRLAYRSIGQGTPILLCARYRGNMDIWDPAFLDALVANGLRVITFDYTGLGLSTGTPTYDPPALAQDAGDLIEALGLDKVVISGWSLGGMAAQLAMAMFPDRISHAVLIGTTPPGPLVKAGEQLFYDTATKPDYTLEDETILFFEPASAGSRDAARQSVQRIASRVSGRSIPVPQPWAKAALAREPANPIFPVDSLLEMLKTTTIPVLHIGGDHDIVFPIENWYALNQQLPTLQLLTFPRSGHGPHHQYPEATADYIASFIRTTA
ncbi:alpha/beta fold hydrolase [Roseomonas sp. F4]